MRRLGFLIAASAILLAVSPAQATLIGGGPPEAGLSGDDGTELFTPNGEILGVEIVDNLSVSGFLTAFGFYFESDPATHIMIFGPADDVNTGPQAALINFSQGLIIDLDQGGTLDNAFVPQAEDIGFYLDLDLGSSIVTAYTEMALNAGGIDLAATFFDLSNTEKYTVAFEDPQGNLLSGHRLTGINPAAAGTLIPEPTAALVFGLGFAIVSWRMRKRSH